MSPLLEELLTELKQRTVINDRFDGPNGSVKMAIEFGQISGLVELIDEELSKGV